MPLAPPVTTATRSVSMSSMRGDPRQPVRRSEDRTSSVPGAAPGCRHRSRRACPGRARCGPRTPAKPICGPSYTPAGGVPAADRRPPRGRGRVRRPHPRARQGLRRPLPAARRRRSPGGPGRRRPGASPPSTATTSSASSPSSRSTAGWTTSATSASSSSRAPAGTASARRSSSSGIELGRSLGLRKLTRRRSWPPTPSALGAVRTARVPPRGGPRPGTSATATATFRTSSSWRASSASTG